LPIREFRLFHTIAAPFGGSELDLLAMFSSSSKRIISYQDR